MSTGKLWTITKGSTTYFVGDPTKKILYTCTQCPCSNSETRWVVYHMGYIIANASCNLKKYPHTLLCAQAKIDGSGKPIETSCVVSGNWGYKVLDSGTTGIKINKYDAADCSAYMGETAVVMKKEYAITTDTTVTFKLGAADIPEGSTVYYTYSWNGTSKSVESSSRYLYLAGPTTECDGSNDWIDGVVLKFYTMGSDGQKYPLACDGSSSTELIVQAGTTLINETSCYNLTFHYFYDSGQENEGVVPPGGKHVIQHDIEIGSVSAERLKVPNKFILTCAQAAIPATQQITLSTNCKKIEVSAYQVPLDISNDIKEITDAVD